MLCITPYICYYLGMRVELIREKRRTIALRINTDGMAVLKVPAKFPDHMIDEFLYSKRKWINEKILFMKDQATKAENHEEIDYEGKFKEKILPLVKEIGERCQIKCKQVESMHSKAKWGSFDTKGKMRLNYKLCALPDELIEYVIIHEYCHALEMNHSERFWKCVEKYDSLYKEHRKALKAFSYVLNRS